MDAWAILGLVLFNAGIPLTVWWWRRVSRDEVLVRGIPARSAAPLFIALPAAFDVTLLASIITGHFSDALFLAVLMAGLALTLSTWVARFPAWAIPPNIRQPGRVTHDLGIYYVGERDGATEPYYVALCSCGWHGDTFPDREHADLQARHHRPELDPPLRRPGQVGAP
jgi:hypothetical protein